MDQPLDRKRIVIATDGSVGAGVAVEQGVWLAKMLGAKAIFVSVVHTPLPVLGDPYYQRALSADLARCRKAIDAAVLAARERALPHETEILEGSAADAILELARARDASLIVVGSRGRGGIAGAVLGSVSDSLGRRADRPVLVARPGASAPAGRLRAAI